MAAHVCYFAAESFSTQLKTKMLHQVALAGDR